MGGAALGGVLGAVTGLGLFLIVCGLRGTAAVHPGSLWRAAAGRARRQATTPRAAATLAAAVTVAAVTRWPVGTVLAGLAAWFLPPILGPDREHAEKLQRIEAIAMWTEQLRDTLAAAAGLEQAILATAPIAPGPLRSEVATMADAIRRSERLPDALRAFAVGAADPTADLVVAALLLAAEQQARDLGQMLSSLADSARQHAQMRMRIAASRARVRTAARIIIAATVALSTGLLAWSRAFLHPYDTALGQFVLAAVGGCFAGAFWWLDKMSRLNDPPRILIELGGPPDSWQEPQP